MTESLSEEWLNSRGQLQKRKLLYKQSLTVVGTQDNLLSLAEHPLQLSVMLS